MRFLLAITLVYFSFTLVSCTTGETSDDSNLEQGSGSAAPIDEGELGAADGAVAKNGGEDDFENELESEPSAATTPEQQSEQTLEEPPVDDLDQELSAQNQAGDELQPAPEETPPMETLPPTPVEEKTKITDIRYLSNSNGGTVVIETSQPVTFQSRMNSATRQFVIELANVELPAALQHPYNMKEFGSRFGGINAYQSPGSTTARVVIQMAKAGPEPMVQQEGTSLVVIPQTTAPPVAERELAPPPSQQQEPPPASDSRPMALSAKTLDEFLTGNQRFYGRPISLQVKDADVRDVVNFLAEESGANVVMSDDVSGKISLKLRKIPWDQALVTVMRSKALGYVRQGNVLRISTMKALQAETDAANKLIESQKAISPSVVQVIPISYAAVEDIKKSAEPFLTGTGKVVTDARSSTVIVTDKADIVERITKLIKTLDIAPAQVSIESKIVEAVEGFNNFFGVNWGFRGAPVNLSQSGGSYGAPVDMSLGLNSFNVTKDVSGAAPFSANFTVGTMDIFGDLAATLTLAEKDSLAKVISSPRISAMNREKATIVQQGENLSVIATRSEMTGVITKTEKRTPFKLQLEVTPQITADGGVIMELDVQREFLGPIIDQDLGSREINTRKAKTKVLVRNGQTAVIGGIYTSDETEANIGLPVIKNIPVLGWLFKSHSVQRNKNELLIFLTPRILSSDNIGSEQASN